MSDEILSELLARSVEGVPVADPPVDSLVRRGRAARLRRRRTAVLGAALACLLVIGGAGLARQLTHSDPSSAAGPPQPPAGTKWVGIGRTVVAVPAAWPVIPGLYCPGPPRPYVTIVQWHVLVSCRSILGQPHREPVPSISISGTAAGLFNAEGTSSHPVVLPRGWLAIPASGPAGGVGPPTVTGEIDALEAAGFTVELRSAGPDNRLRPVTTDPEIGTPARVGSTVVVYDHGTSTSSARLKGTLAWVGGPAPGAPRPHAGVVHVTNADDSVDQTIRTDAAGRWTMYLPPGTYSVLATSPGYLSAAGEPDACSADGRVTVAAGQVVTADVYCHLM